MKLAHATPEKLWGGLKKMTEEQSGKQRERETEDRLNERIVRERALQYIRLLKAKEIHL